jgi:DNA-binding FadR family transcriptional regulator
MGVSSLSVTFGIVSVKSGGLEVTTPGRKLGETLAEKIENEIIAAGWQVGEVIGSEGELRNRYGVSRAVFREAIRIVGHHGVAEMRRGPGGGLVVSKPRVDAAVRTLLLNLEYLNISPEQINEARLAIEISCVRTATKNLTGKGEERIREFLETEVDLIVEDRESGKPSDDYPSNQFHLLLAELTGNPAMVLFVQILSSVTSRHSSPAESRANLEEAAAAVHRAHSRIAEAILARDADAAERRLKRHLSAIIGYMHD